MVCSRGSYEGGTRHPASETRDGVRVRRLWAPALGRGSVARALEAAAFLAGTSAAVLGGPKPDLVLGLTTPPFLGLWVRAAANLRGARHAHWVMDVYPDVLAAHGWLSARGPAFRALQALARLQLEGAALVLGLGPVQGQRIAAYARRAVPWVPLWSAAGEPAAADAVAAAHAEHAWPAGDLVLLYSGNLGRGHALDEFLSAARRLGPGGPIWAFAGAGARAREVAAFAAAERGARVQVLPYLPRERLAALLGAADVHLASMRGAWQGLIVPSKVQAAFTAGRPIIFVGGRDNEPAGWIERSGGGWRVDEGDVEGLLRAVDEARDASERARRGDAARAYAREHFDRTRNCERIVEMLEGALRAGA